jgi:hypothetical protein
MTRSRATLALATTAASAAFLAPALPASAAVTKGLQDQEMTVNQPGLTPAFLTAAQEANVGLVRFNTRWDGQASAPDPAQVAAIKAFAAKAAAAGIGSIEVSPNISGDASFNPRGKGRGPKATDKISQDAYRAYIRALATALKDVPVARFYSAINEPNWFRHIPQRGGAILYRRLHNIAYEEIKAVDPAAKVLFGELLPYARPTSKSYPHGQSADPGAFVREALGLTKSWKGRGRTASYAVKADGVSLHTYDFQADPSRKSSKRGRDAWVHANLDWAKADLRKAARTKRLPSAAAKRIYLTEFAYKTSGSDKLSTSKASSYLKKAWTVAKKQKVRSFLWYQLRDPTSTDELWQSGLQTRDGGVRSTWTTFKSLR